MKMFSYIKRKLFSKPLEPVAPEEPVIWQPPGGYVAVLDPFYGGATCPHTDDLLFLREGWDRPLRARFCDLHPAMNMAGLYWRPFTAMAIELTLDELPIASSETFLTGRVRES